MVRWVLVALAVLLLAGCASPDPVDPTEPAGPADADASPQAAVPGLDSGPQGAAFPATIARGTEPFHERDALGLERMAFQTTGFCYNTDTNEVLSWMFHLSERLGAAPVPDGTASLELTVRWGPEDYVGEALGFLARPPDSAVYTRVTVSPGQPVSIPVSPAQWESADSSGWDFWLCTTQAAPDVDPRVRTAAPFVGAVEVDLVARA